MATRLRPSPALIVATVALFIAIGGSAYAAGTINGKSIVNHSIAGKKLKSNTLGGSQINESGLGAVPHAATAGRAANADAVGGVTVRKVFYAPPAPTSTPTKILQLGGLVLTATCANGDLEVVVTARSTMLSWCRRWQITGGVYVDGQHHSDLGQNSAQHVEGLGNGNA